MKAMLWLAILFNCSAAHAFTITLACSPATKYTDGTTIPAGTVSAFKFFAASQGQPKVLVTPTAVNACSFIWAVMNPGTYCAEVSQVTQGAESDHSPEACLTIAQPKPQAPGAPTLALNTTSTVAYVIQNGNDRLAFLIVGSVPLGTACVPSESANGFYVVPRAKVTFDGPARPTAVVARCG